MSEQMPYALLNWIKKDQAERIAFALKRAQRNYKEDEQFMDLIAVLVNKWNKLKTSEKIFIQSLNASHASGKCFSGAQRSAITSLWIKHSA